MIKEILNFEGRYTIDENGNIYSNGKKMKPYIINSGYLAIKLQYKGKRYHYLVHRLVAEYFLKGSGVVDHIDGNRLNNKASNLRYCTQFENLHFHGYYYNSGVSHYSSIFNEKDIKNIRDCRETKHMRNCEIYKLYPSISHSAIDQVLNYKTYKKIPC